MDDAILSVWERFLNEMAQSSPLELLVRIVGFVIVLLLIYAQRRLVARIWRWLRRRLTRTWDAKARLSRARETVAENGPGLWLTIKHNPHPPAVLKDLADTKKLILTVANLKGGVAKTTLTANLAAYFANPFNDRKRQSRRVLVIDLDFQGSLSSMMFAGTAWTPSGDKLSPSSLLISGELGPHFRGDVGQPIVDCPGARGVGAFYDLARVENREMVHWLIKDCNDDVRYRLAHILLSDAVLPHVDVILIDAPPRLTTGCIRALCASTHVLIPTIPDPLAATGPVGYFGAQLKAHECLFPHLKVLGVIGTKTDPRSREAEEKAIKAAAGRLRDALRGSVGNLGYIETKNTSFEFPHDRWLVDSTPLARAAERGIAYVSLGNTQEAEKVRKNFDIIGNEVQRRWDLCR